MSGSRARHWLLWFLGAVLLGAVIAAGLHFSDVQDFVQLAEHSEPSWLLLALLLQAGTYLAQGEVFRCVARAGGFPLRVSTVYKLSLAKLFVDQALPSAGLSGSFLLANFLEQRGMRRALVAADIVIDITSYYVAYVSSLTAAVIFAALHGEASKVILVVSVVFALFAIALTAVILTVSGHRTSAWTLRVAHFRPLRSALQFLEHADRSLIRNPRLLLETTAYQLAIFLCDAATMWVLIKSLGMSASATNVFTSFMISTLFRSVGVLPGGLGSFEAASILTLKMGGIPVAMGLAATLLFRGLSFWIPMLPGLWCSRRLMARPITDSSDAHLED